jgi:hypothetical protein
MRLVIDDAADTSVMRFLELTSIDGVLYAIWQRSADELVAKTVELVRA